MKIQTLKKAILKVLIVKKAKFNINTEINNIRILEISILKIILLLLLF